jgi:hypothetical protein
MYRNIAATDKELEMLKTSQAFPDALAVRFPQIVIDSTTEAGYIRVQTFATEDEPFRKMLFNELSTLAAIYQWSFDGFDENGYPCFIL